MSLPRFRNYTFENNVSLTNDVVCFEKPSPETLKFRWLEHRGSLPRLFRTRSCVPRMFFYKCRYYNIHVLGINRDPLFYLENVCCVYSVSSHGRFSVCRCEGMILRENLKW